MALIIAVIILLGLGVSKARNGILKLNKEIKNKNQTIQQLNEIKTKLENEKQNLEKQKEELQKKLEAKVHSTQLTRNVYAKVSTVNVEQWRPIVAQYNWPVEDALKIMACESSGVTTRHNYNPTTKDNSWGLFQINLWGSNANSRPPASELVKPEVSIAYAHKIWSSSGRFGTTHGWYNCARKVKVT